MPKKNNPNQLVLGFTFVEFTDDLTDETFLIKPEQVKMVRPTIPKGRYKLCFDSKYSLPITVKESLKQIKDKLGKASYTFIK